MSVQVPKGYKQTEVGVIPEDWELSTIGENTKWLSGGTPSRSKEEYWKGDIPWISGSTLKSVEISISDQFLTMEAVSAGSKMAPLNSTLLLVRGSALHNEIRAGQVVKDVAFNQDVKALVPSAYLYPKFLTFYILGNSGNLLKLVSSAGNSAGVLDTKLVQNFLFLKPSLEEQKTIAEALSEADALIESLEQLIVKKRQIKQGAMQELLTGQRRLPGFSGEWTRITMRELLSMTATYGIVTAGNFVDNGIKMLRGGDISDGYINLDVPMVTKEKSDEYSRTKLIKNDVVISLVGYPGESGKIPDSLIGANISRAVGLLRLNKRVDPDYLVCFLNSDFGRKMVLAPSAGSAQQVVNLSELNKLSFDLPEIEEQTAISEMITSMKDEIQELEKRLLKLRMVKQSMMQELLTGRIRLI